MKGGSSRLRPYAVDGQQIDVQCGGPLGGQSDEIGECGLANQEKLLVRCGCSDDDRWSGLAMGLGLDGESAG